MPCSEDSRDREEERNAFTRAVQLLCAICKGHPDWVQQDQELKKWWEKHKKSSGHED